MIRQSPLQESDRFNTNHANLCPALRWKGQFILAEPIRPCLNRMKACSGAFTPKPASVRMANWPNPATAHPPAENVMARESVDR